MASRPERLISRLAIRSLLGALIPARAPQKIFNALDWVETIETITILGTGSDFFLAPIFFSLPVPKMVMVSMVSTQSRALKIFCGARAGINAPSGLRMASLEISLSGLEAIMVSQISMHSPYSLSAPLSGSTVHRYSSSGPLSGSTVHRYSWSGPLSRSTVHRYSWSGPGRRPPVHRYSSSGPLSGSTVHRYSSSGPLSGSTVHRYFWSGPGRRAAVHRYSSSGPLSGSTVHRYS